MLGDGGVPSRPREFSLGCKPGRERHFRKQDEVALLLVDMRPQRLPIGGERARFIAELAHTYAHKKHPRNSWAPRPNFPVKPCGGGRTHYPPQKRVRDGRARPAPPSDGRPRQAMKSGHGTENSAPPL